MPNWPEQLNEARQQYLSAIKSEIPRLKDQYELTIPEVALELPNRGASPFCYWVVDIGCRNGDNFVPVEINLDTVSNINYSAGSTCGTVRILNLNWNDAIFSINGNPSDVLGFEAWVVRWLDLDETRTPDDDGFRGIVHGVTEPQLLNGFWGFSVDLGSAPVDALIELIELLQQGGISEISIHTDTGFHQ